MIDPLTDIRAALATLARLPPEPFFASCALFSSDHAISFRHEGRDYVGGHPCFWARVDTRLAGSGPQCAAGSWCAIEIVDIDANQERRDEFIDAMIAAMSPASVDG